MLYGPSNNKNYQNRFPESTFHHFCGQAMKMLKICFQKLLLTISGASHGKCLKSTSGGYFWPYLVPSSENAQNQLPEATFNNIRGQATKMLKIDYWSVHWTISWNLLPSTWKMIPGACYQVLYTIYDILYTIYHIPYTIYYILYTIYYILYTIYYILYTIYYLLYTIYYILYTI